MLQCVASPLNWVTVCMDSSLSHCVDQNTTLETRGSLNQQEKFLQSGVYLTWKDICVTVSRGKNGTKSILEGLTGYACPGQVLAIMGPSGCGKSTLLDALAGRLDSRTRQKGEILINGQKQNLAYGTSAYVTQEDPLTWTLTVREAVYYSARLQLPLTMSQAEKREIAKRSIREMGLQDCIDTTIGGYGRKGLSSGQKRRLSICTGLLRRPKLIFLDEPTSGLDSAASYFVMSKIVKLSRDHGMTIIASIHQPISEVFVLLHNLCLLSEGRTVYFGPSCASNQNPADHYLRMINNDFDEDIELGTGRKMPTHDVINQLVRSYRLSDICNETERRLSELHGLEGGNLEKGNQSNLITQCLVLTERSLVNMYRDQGYYWLRLAMYIALGFGLGTVFYKVGSSYNSIHARGSLLMFVASLLTIMAIGGFPSFVEDLKVFRCERLNGHYGVVAFVIGNTISSTPFLLLISVIPGAITYYLAGLQPGYAQFSYFILVLFACMMLVESLMLMVASIMPNFLTGLIVGAGIQGLMMLSGGFFQLPNNLPNVLWRYPLYYVAFHKYAYQGLYKNEFEGLRFANNDGASSTIDGETILRDVWEVEMGYSKWIDLGILFGMVVLYRLMFLAIVKIGEKRAKSLVTR